MDQFYGKMKTPVGATPELEEAGMEETRRNPGRFDHLKLFPRSSWEFCKWDRVDTIGFLSCLAVSWAVYLALQAAVFWGIATILLRKTALEERTLVQMLISSALLMVFTGLALPFLWQPLSLSELALIVGTGVLAGVGQYALFEGMRRAEVSLLAPFEYSSLIWGFLLGFLIWHEVPSANVFVGAGLIIGAGVLVIGAERSARRAVQS